MTRNLKSVCLITGGLAEGSVRLQPWRYLYEVARQLGNQGHEVTVISDSDTGHAHVFDKVGDICLRRIPSVTMGPWQSNPALQHIVEQAKPEIVLWHVGLTSFLYQRTPPWMDMPVVGIFTSPIYGWGEIARLGMSRVVGGYRLSSTHIIGTLAPKLGLRKAMQQQICRLVVQTQTTADQLHSLGVGEKDVTVIRPGVDEAWKMASEATVHEIRREWGFGTSDIVVLYFGSPAPLRGLHTLIRALSLARCTDASLKLVVLSRRHAGELIRENAELSELLTGQDIQRHIHLVSGFLREDALVQQVAACDIVALPFELVPSDAPLSLLEAQALGKPVVTTRVACLPELVSSGISYIAEPGDPVSLANRLLQAAKTWCSKKRLAERASKPAQIRRWQQVGEEWSGLVETL